MCIISGLLCRKSGVIGCGYCLYKINQFLKLIEGAYTDSVVNSFNHEQGNAMSLINTKIKPFKAQAYHNGKFVEVTDQTVAGKWSVFVFYPADFTFVCPTELEDLAETYAEFQKLGVEIYSVSTDTHFSHKAWHDTSAAIGKVNYPMIADPTHVLSRNFEVLIEEEGIALRGTFVVNPEGEIKVMEVHDNGIGRVASELLRKVKAAQYIASHPGEVCPAKWNEGAETLKPSLDLVGKI